MRINESYARSKVTEKHYANLEKFYPICQCVTIGLSVNKEDLDESNR